VVADIAEVWPEIGIVAVPDQGRSRTRNQRQRERRIDPQEPRRNELGPTGRFLQRAADQEAAETEEHLDRDLAEVLAETRHLRLRQSGQIEVMAEQHGGCGAEADEVVAVRRTRTHRAIAAW